MFGHYTINPETAGLNHQEKEPKIKVLDLKEFIGQPRSEVMAHVVKTYGDKYNIPGLEYERYLIQNPDKDKVPAELKDGKYYNFMGSTLRDQRGDSSFPCVRWDEGRLLRTASLLVLKWDESDRVLLLEK